MSLIRFLTFANLALAATNTIFIPPSPTQGSAKLDAAPVSFSLEFFEFPTYMTNFKNTFPCISGLKELTGVWPNIRIGGSTQDRAAFDPALTTYVNYTLPENASMGFPDVLTYGPSYLQLAGSYPGNVVLGLNRGSNNIANTIEGAIAAQKYIKNLYAIELGNEPDSEITPRGSFIRCIELTLFQVFAYTGAAIAPDPTAWTAQADATSQQEWQIAVGTALENTSIIQAGVFYQPPPEYGAQELLANEDPSAIPYIKTFSHHNYPQDPVSNLANLTKLMSHINVVKNVDGYATDVQASRNAGVEYVFGESNSVSGGGNISVSPTFGAALWVADYALQTASANISHIYFHQAAINACYYLWWHNNTVTSPYYGGYFATAAMAGTSYIQPLDDRTTNYAAYALYSKDKKLKRVALINSDYYDGIGQRDIQTFVLTGLGVSTSVIRVRRLTADSALAKQDDGDNPRFGGQSFSNSTCRLDGEEAREEVLVSDGSVNVSVASSEAVLLEFETC